MNRFEWAIRAEFATQHVMHELGKTGRAIDLFLYLGYDLMLNDPKKWNAIQKTYDMEIRRCLKNKIGNRRGFRYKALADKGGE
jgi:hypothetical protein